MTRTGRETDRGTVTAELAIGMVGVSVVLAALFSVVAVGLAQVRVADAAAAGARLAARGEPTGTVRETASALAGSRASVAVGAAGGLTEVTVSRPVTLLLPGRPVVEVRSQALAVTEGGKPP